MFGHSSPKEVTPERVNEVLVEALSLASIDMFPRDTRGRQLTDTEQAGYYRWSPIVVAYILNYCAPYITPEIKNAAIDATYQRLAAHTNWQPEGGVEQFRTDIADTTTRLGSQFPDFGSVDKTKDLCKQIALTVFLNPTEGDEDETWMGINMTLPDVINDIKRFFTNTTLARS